MAERPRRCSIQSALDLVGDRWSLLVMRELAFGNHRFGQIQAATGAPKDILSARLRKLEQVGVVVRDRDPDRPKRLVYRATKAGRELTPLILQLKEWGDRHVNPGHEPLVTQHVCGATFHPRVHCAACGEQLHPNELTVVAGDEPLPIFERV